ncbi:MAG: translation initiation factor [Flavobacteriales bacterium]|nr:translation initiation factor [Flavobacteriales bacterium]
MAKKKLGLSDLGGLVFSTDPDLIEHEPEEESSVSHPSEQRLRVRIDKKGRKGKVVTLVEGFEGREEALQNLARELKTYCGTGGSVKDQQIIIQGDMLAKVRSKLLLDGYHVQK